MNRKRGFTLIELIVTLCIISIIGGCISYNVSNYFKTVNTYETKFAENSILAIICNSKQYCREKNKSGYLIFDIVENKICFYSDGVLKDSCEMPGKIKLNSINSFNNKININRKGFTSDACTITIRDKYERLYYITLCVGTAFVEIKE